MGAVKEGVQFHRCLSGIYYVSPVINTSFQRRVRYYYCTPGAYRREKLFAIPFGKANGTGIYRVNGVKVRSGRRPREGF